MNEGDRVMTEYGLGTLLRREGKEGFTYYRWCVKLDAYPKNLDFSEIIARFGGIFFLEGELKQETKQAV